MQVDTHTHRLTHELERRPVSNSLRSELKFGFKYVTSQVFEVCLSSTQTCTRSLYPAEQRSKNARLVAAIPWAIKHRGQGIEGSASAGSSSATQGRLSSNQIRVSVSLVQSDSFTPRRLSYRPIKSVYSYLSSNQIRVDPPDLRLLN